MLKIMRSYIKMHVMKKDYAKKLGQIWYKGVFIFGILNPSK